MAGPDPADLPYRPCVGVMLADAEGRLFVGQRSDRDEPAWQMPQGGIDAGESPREAALRELREETGIAPGLVRVEAETVDWLAYDLPEHLIGKVWGGRYRGQRQKWVLMRYLGEDGQIALDTGHPEFSAHAWMTPDEVLAAIVPFKRDVYARVLEEFAPRL